MKKLICLLLALFAFSSGGSVTLHDDSWVLCPSATARMFIGVSIMMLMILGFAVYAIGALLPAIKRFEKHAQKLRSAGSLAGSVSMVLAVVYLFAPIALSLEGWTAKTDIFSMAWASVFSLFWLAVAAYLLRNGLRGMGKERGFRIAFLSVLGMVILGIIIMAIGFNLIPEPEGCLPMGVL